MVFERRNHRVGIYFNDDEIVFAIARKEIDRSYRQTHRLGGGDRNFAEPVRRAIARFSTACSLRASPGSLSMNLALHDEW